MVPRGQDLSAQLGAFFAAATEALDAGPAPDLPPLAGYGPYHQAAAVLSSFVPDGLAPVPGQGADDDDIAELLRDCERFHDPDGHERWALTDHVRRETLAQLGTRERIEAALAANAHLASRDPVAGLLAAYLRGTAPPVGEQDATQVAAVLELSQWLAGVDAGLRDALPDAEDVRARSDLLALLQPFRDLAGEHFAGRTAELQRLRDHVGVMPPGSVRERLHRAAREALNVHGKRPLLIYGPGGVGKSSLVARFIWEHVTLPDAERFPFAYLDLDRGTLRPEEPLTLLVEAVRQLGLEYEQHRQFADRLRHEWQHELVERNSTAPAGGPDGPATVRAPVTDPYRRRPVTVRYRNASRPKDWARYLDEFSSLLRHLKADQDPFLFVLDTFEEVQYRGDVVTGALARFLQMFQDSVPRMRLVVSGRARVELPGLVADDLELGDFDADAALAYLTRRGVQPPALARSIVKRFGGSPLTLALAAEAWRQTPDDADLRDIGTRGAFGKRLADQMIQGQLYRRILRHVHDERVQQLAHPGLVLRRITPDLIQHVLAGPCGVDVPDAQTAQELFEAMAREVSLVRVEGSGPDRVLQHRRDVRRVMIGLLRASADETGRRIEDAAIARYRSSQDPVERAEEIYHRLSLRHRLDTVADRWLPGVEQYLFSALEDGELEAPERAWLASRLDRPLTEDERAAADQQSWERDARRRVTELMARGESEAALKALAARPERAPGSPLFALEATALMNRGRLDDARAVLHRGIASLEDRTDPDASFDLMLRAAVLELRGGSVPAARRTLRRARLLLDPDKDRVRWVDAGLIEMAVDLADGEDPVANGRVADLVARLALVTDEQLRGNQLTAVAAAAQLGAHSTEALARVLATVGLTSRRRAPLRQLARALARWDLTTSRVADQWQGVLGGQDLRWAENLTQAWTRFVLDSDAETLGEKVAALLTSGDPPAEVVETLTAVLRETTGALVAQTLGDEDPTTGAPAAATMLKGGPVVTPFGTSGGYRDVGVRVSREQLTELRSGLVEAFRSRKDLAQMLRHRLSRSLDSIAPTDDLTLAARLLVEQAQQQGWTATLVAAGLESRPDSPGLHAVAEELGLSAPVPAVPELAKEIEAAGGSFDVDGWRVRLGALEAQVCRVEIADGKRTRYGSGFLVGPDLVLTTYDVVRPVVDGAVPPVGVRLRFDHRALLDGSTVTPGTVFGLSERSWLVAASPTPGPASGTAGKAATGPALDFALMRVAGTPGAEPIGGDRAEPDAAPRGWVPLPDPPRDVVPGDPLYLLHHPDGGPVRISVNRRGVLGLTPDGDRLLHRAPSAEGSAGAPCFGRDWELLAVHERTDGGTGYAVPVHLVLAELARQGLRGVLDPVPL